MMSLRKAHDVLVTFNLQYPLYFVYVSTGFVCVHVWSRDPDLACPVPCQRIKVIRSFKDIVLLLLKICCVVFVVCS